jgi:fused signal recognition particle receptor
MVLLIVLIAVAAVIVASGALALVTTRRRRLPPGPARPVPAGPARGVPAPVAGGSPEAPPAPASTLESGAPAGTIEVVDDPEVTDGPVGVVALDEPAVDVAAELGAPPRFRDRLGRARGLFGGYLSAVRSRGRIDASTWDELEEALILGDVGATTAATLIEGLRARVKQEGITSPEDLLEALKAELVEMLDGERELKRAAEGTTVWLFVGVNGVGKTTTIGKLGMRQVADGHRVVMAAGDTFRAAAADQLEMWAERVGAGIIRGNEGGDPGAVVFDAVQHAAARQADLVLADTAGRLHTKTNLMEELKKIRRVAERPPGQVTEVLLVIDATTGQNGLIQARQFAGAVGVTGVVLTKLDGTAKGGIVVAIRSELGIPIKLVGLGEGPADLVDFDAREFVDALFNEDEAA